MRQRKLRDVTVKRFLRRFPSVDSETKFWPSKGFTLASVITLGKRNGRLVIGNASY